MAAYQNAQNISHLETEDWHRTIFVDTLQINGFDFNIDLENQKRLVESGRQGVINYFKWYDKDKFGPPGLVLDIPYNRPDFEILARINRKKT